MGQAILLRQLGVTVFLFCLGSLLCGCREEIVAGKPSNSPPAFGPKLLLRANVPGLTSESIAELIAGPVEKQLAALEGLLLIESLSIPGLVEFHLHTKAGGNLKQLESLIADRIASIKDTLPQAIADPGFEILPKTAPLLAVGVYSPDKQQNLEFLSNYANTIIRDQLTQIPGMGKVTLFGAGAAGDEVTIKQQPAIALLLAPTLDAKTADIATELRQRLAELRTELPPGVIVTLAINTIESPDPREQHLLLELQQGQDFDASRRSLQLSNTNTRLRTLPGIKNWISFARHPLETGNPNPCIMLHVAAADPEQAAQKVRAAIQTHFSGEDDSKIQLKLFGKPDTTLVRAAVCGPEPRVADELAEQLAAKLSESRSYTVTHQRRPTDFQPSVLIKLDRSKMAALGVTSTEISTAIAQTFGQAPHDDAAREQIHLPNALGAMNPALLGQITMKNAQGNEIRLSELATFESSPSLMAVYRVNNQPAVLLTAQVFGEQAQANTREQVNALFAAVRGSKSLGEEYKLVWIEE